MTCDEIKQKLEDIIIESKTLRTLNIEELTKNNKTWELYNSINEKIELLTLDYESLPSDTGKYNIEFYKGVILINNEFKSFIQRVQEFVRISTISSNIKELFEKYEKIYNDLEDKTGIIEKLNLEIVKFSEEFPNIKDEIKVLKSTTKEINDLKNSLYSFFGLIVGLLAFIFVNFQLITTATSLSLGKMIIYMGLANVGLITGIAIILIILSLLLQTEKENKLIEKIKNNKKIIMGSLIGISLSILAVGIGTYFGVDKPENRDIIKRIEKLEGDKSSNNILGININDDKSLNSEERIKELQKEIENLKNKK